MTTAAAVQDSDQHPLDKGKARARPTERTPLLASPLSPTRGGTLAMTRRR